MGLFGMSDVEKKKILEQHKELERKEKEKKDGLKSGVAFKQKPKEEPKKSVPQKQKPKAKPAKKK